MGLKNFTAWLDLNKMGIFWGSPESPTMFFITWLKYQIAWSAKPMLTGASWREGVVVVASITCKRLTSQ